MPAHPKAFEVLAARIKAATTPAAVDALLDTWLDYRDRATGWDAERWGFHPDLWQARERQQLANRDAFAADVVPLDDAL